MFPTKNRTNLLAVGENAFLPFSVVVRKFWKAIQFWYSLYVFVYMTNSFKVWE